MIVTDIETNSITPKPELQRVSCIQYLIQFPQPLIKVIIDSGSKVNVMQPSFAKKLSLYVRKTDICIQKIDGSRLEIFGMIITFFLVKNKDRRFRFFKKTFLLAYISINVAVGILFFILSNFDINFTDWELK